MKEHFQICYRTHSLPQLYMPITPIFCIEMVFMAKILEEKENQALQTLKEHFFSLNGKELQLREQGEQFNQYFDDVNGHKVKSWEQGELHLGECSGYALKDGHAVTINLQIDRPHLPAAKRNQRFDDLRNINQMYLIPQVLTEFPHLERLCLEGLYTSIPDFVFEIRSLKELKITSIYLKKLPDNFEKLNNLTRLEISACIDICQLPTSIGNILSLCRIKLNDLPRLRGLPESFENLRNIEEIEIPHTGIETIPHSIIKLPKIRKISAFACPNLILSDDILDLSFECILRLDMEVVQRSTREIQEFLVSKQKFGFAFLTEASAYGPPIVPIAEPTCDPKT